MKPLLAKSDPPTTLVEHIADGLKIVTELQRVLPAASQVVDIPDFWGVLRTCVLLHDLGKAHPEFQKLLVKLDNEWNGQRHELFSLPFVNALNAVNHELLPVILRVVAFHHKDVRRLDEQVAAYEDQEGFQQFFEEIDVTAVLKEVTSAFHDFPVLCYPIGVFYANQLLMAYKDLIRKHDAHRYFSELLIFGAFKHCDHLASAYVEELVDLREEHFASLDTLQQGLQAKGFDLYTHQQLAAQTKGNIILRAPTGAGKTESALLWLRHHWKTEPAGHVFYVLPYTASINAMHQRLEGADKGFGDGEVVGALHGKLTAYLYTLFAEESSLLDRQKKVKELKNQFKTAERPVKVLTPFQLLKHLFGLRGFEKGLFELVGGYFIFDEIHAYEPEVQAQIEVLLDVLTRKLGARVCIMTATMPSFLRDQLSNNLHGGYTAIEAAPDLYDHFRRHQIAMRPGTLEHNWPFIQNLLDAGNRVLVVCNTVKQAQTTYQAFERENDKLMIHGRFAAIDRMEHEKALASRLPKLLIGTQAIEVSLDIDYDVMVSQLAPLDALIQRMGRVNRGRRGDWFSCYICTDMTSQDIGIYGEYALRASLEVLQELVNKHDGKVYEEALGPYVDQVYPGYQGKELSAYKMTKDLLGQRVEEELYPYVEDAKREEDFYQRFDGIKVVPTHYEETVMESLRTFDFIRADLHKVSISAKQYRRIRAEGRIYEAHVPVETMTRKGVEKLVDLTFLVIQKRYDPFMGLILEADALHGSSNLIF